MSIKPQHKFLAYLRFKRHLLCCNEVSNYGSIADVLAVDKRKFHTIEFEFKKNSHDLKVKEKKKRKYRSTWYKWPHRFYFVVSQKLWEKEKEYLKSQEYGVIVYYTNDITDYIDFLTVKPCKIRKENVQDFDKVKENILIRCTSAYAALLRKM